MDNFAFKETGRAARPSRRVRINRAVSVYNRSHSNSSAEEVPLTGVKYKRSISDGGRWRGDFRSFREKKSESFDFGAPPSPSDAFPSVPLSYEEASLEINNNINIQTIKVNIYNHAVQASVQANILDKISTNTLSIESASLVFKILTRLERNYCLLWCSLHANKPLLEVLLYLSVDIHFHDGSGMTPLHLASLVGSVECCEYLISKGTDVAIVPKYFSPLHCAIIGNNPDVIMLLIDNDADVTAAINIINCEENALHCAVRANAVECLNLLIELKEINVSSIEPSGANPIHLAAILGRKRCLELLLNSEEADIDAFTRIRDKSSSALHLAANGGHIDCVNLLLNRGADVKLKNHRGFTALHLAARSSSLECVEAILKIGKADPNDEDFDKRTPLHIAIVKSDRASDVIEMLIRWGADINKKDEHGFTPLHAAALDNLTHCVSTLIHHDADVTTKTKKGSSALNVITRKTPVAMGMIMQKLDEAITLQNSDEASDREVELQFDFNNILKHCHPREINYLNSFVDEGQKEILLHPLCSAFLHIKWEKIRKYYLTRLLFHFLFVLFLSLYILTALARNCYNSTVAKDRIIEPTKELCQNQSMLGEVLRNNPYVIETQWWVLAAITGFEICRKIYGMAGYRSIRQYLAQIENLMEWFVIVSVFLISYVYTNSTYTWQNHVGAFAVLSGWTNLMLMIGQLPAFGSYVAMYQKVQKEFGKLFMAYVCILIGFTISFCVIFPDSSMFSNPFMGFITVVTMMIGEQDLSLLINDPKGIDPPFLLEISAQITYILFLIFVTIVLMNLLVGIAVPDIEELKKTAGLSKLVRQTKLISYMETGLFNIFLPKCLKDVLRDSALVFLHPQNATLSVKPLDPNEMRLPKDIMMAAYNITLTTKCGKKINHGLTYNRVNSNASTESMIIIEEKIDREVEAVDVLKREVSDLKALLNIQQEILEKFILAKSNGIAKK